MEFNSLRKGLASYWVISFVGATAAIADQSGTALVNRGLLTRGMDSLAKLQRAQAEIAGDPEVSSLLKSNSLNSVVVTHRVEAEGLETTRFQHYYKGIEVFGSESRFHEGAAGTQIQNTLAKFDVNTTPSLTAETAISIAKSIIGARDVSEAPELKILPDADSDSAKLVYFIDFASAGELAGRQFIIDAHSGQVIANLSKHRDLVPVQVFSTKFQNPRFGNCQNLSSGGDPQGFNLRACAQAVVNGQLNRQLADAQAIRALNNTNRVIGYFASVHKRLGYDGKGSQVVNVVHAGRKYANAFWDTEANLMAYGDGDGVEIGDMTLGLDIAAHEMTHGVTSRSANFLGMGEPGALNEANSDFFAKMVVADGDWSVGRAIFLRPRPGADAIRDLQNPGRLRGPVTFSNGQQAMRPYPSNVAQEVKPFVGCDDSNDGCNVHYNSTVPSHAMYLMTVAVGPEIASKIQYAALTHAMGPNTSFRQYGAAVRSVCQQLYNARVCSAVAQAYASLGL